MTKVFIINKDETLSAVHHSTNQCNIDSDLSKLTLDWERTKHEEKASIRCKNFRAIISNELIKFSWIKLFAASFTIIFFGFVMNIPLTLIPYHDLVQYPKYWYELLLPGTYSGLMGFSYRCITSGSYMNIEHLLRPRNVGILSASGCMFILAVLLVSYIVWTLLFEFQYPIPFLGTVATYVGFVFTITVIWFLFPTKWRQSWNFRKRMRYFIFQLLFTILVTIFYNMITQTIAKSSNKYQPIVALMLPALRELQITISTKLIKKAANGDEWGATILLRYAISVQYIIVLCIVLGSLATNSTSWVLIGVDYFHNLWLTFKIVWMNKRKPEKIMKQIETLEDLALCELAEFHAPVVFIFVFIAASYGPNFRLFGNIGNSYWTFNAIADINQSLTNMIYLFLVDFSSTVASGLILWSSCRIGLWKVFGILQNEFGKIFTIFLGYLLLVVCMNIGI